MVDSMIFNETLAMAIPLKLGSRNPKRGISGGYSGFIPGRTGTTNLGIPNPIDAAGRGPRCRKGPPAHGRAVIDSGQILPLLIQCLYRFAAAR